MGPCLNIDPRHHQSQKLKIGAVNGTFCKFRSGIHILQHSENSQTVIAILKGTKKSTVLIPLFVDINTRMSGVNITRQFKM